MLVHSVFFWLKDGLSDDDVAEFRAGLESLSGIEFARGVHVGTPADTPERPVIDASYTFALTVLLDDLGAQDAYQVHPLHKAFIEAHSPKWERVVIYDAD